MTKIDLMYLADKMVEKGVMKDHQKRNILDSMIGLTEVQRMNKLLNILVQLDGSIFTWFIQILVEYDTLIQKVLLKNYRRSIKRK